MVLLKKGYTISMSLKIIHPCNDLKDYISHFWIADWSSHTADVTSTYYVTASSLTEIAFGFKENSFLFSSIQGQTDRHSQIPAASLYQMLGVSLYAHAIPFLFNLPAPELNNLFLSPEMVLGNDGELLNESIALADTMHERVDILTNYFKSRLGKQRLGDSLILNAVKQIRDCKGNLNIKNLCDHFCFSQKQFERRFRANTGFNPKLYARIIRFEATLTNRSTYNNLTETALANGYYDQAHFIHDFKTFTGYSPNKFFALSGY